MYAIERVAGCPLTSTLLLYAYGCSVRFASTDVLTLAQEEVWALDMPSTVILPESLVDPMREPLLIPQAPRGRQVAR